MFKSTVITKIALICVIIKPMTVIHFIVAFLIISQLIPHRILYAKNGTSSHGPEYPAKLYYEIGESENRRIAESPTRS